MKIKKGDQIKITKGKDRGKSGAVIRVLPSESRITVEGINLYRKRTKPRRQGEKGETVMVARPFSASNAMIICSNCKKAVRVGFRPEGNSKSRYCKKCGAKT
ncbi:MAG: 50S ribosomal protein L24 [Candidatus Liptonbacteria bacterium]|nr:50S ribosomal protein L24 [Candidatus Liptonbacteria bacterium]